MNNKKSKKGFTLVEIMIVVVIIGLLAAMAIPAFQKVRQTSQDKAVVNNLRQIAAAAQQYMLETGSTSAPTDNLIGTGSQYWITTVEQVANETYGILIDTASTQITASPDGTRIVTYTF